jgi:hypothetical protein
MPGILGTFIPPVPQDQNMSYNANSTAAPNEWMFMNWDNPGGIYPG